MTGEAARIERIERLYILEKLIELGIDFQRAPAILAERVGQPVQGENKPLRALAEQLDSQFPSRRIPRPMDASATSKDRAELSLQLEVDARRASASACVCMLVKSDRLGVLEGRLTGDGMLAADVAVAQSHANPFQRAMENASFCGSFASAQLISRRATPVR